MKITRDVLPMALHYFKGKDEIWNKIKEDYPSQLADLTSWKENPDCACGGCACGRFACGDCGG